MWLLRELIQNAHDSCVRRREEDPGVAEGYQPAILAAVWQAEQEVEENEE